MTQCLAITIKGVQCKREAHAGHTLCVYHLYLLDKKRRESGGSSPTSAAS